MKGEAEGDSSAPEITEDTQEKTSSRGEYLAQATPAPLTPSSNDNEDPGAPDPGAYSDKRSVGINSDDGVKSSPDRHQLPASSNITGGMRVGSKSPSSAQSQESPLRPQPQPAAAMTVPAQQPSVEITEDDRQSFLNNMRDLVRATRMPAQDILRMLYACSGNWKIARYVILYGESNFDGLVWTKEQDAVIQKSFADGFLRITGGGDLGNDESKSKLKQLI
ncbi:hypothetical protein EV182_008104, partial [Spiromyces aspiralis]